MPLLIRRVKAVVRGVTLVLVVTAGGAVRAEGQAYSWTVEGGQRRDVRPQGQPATNPFFGFAVAAEVPIQHGDRFTLLVPLTAEGRVAEHGYRDMNSFADAAIRTGPFTAGLGLTMSWRDIPEFSSSIVGQASDLRAVLPLSTGISAMGKLELGSRHRFTVQGRYASLPHAMAFSYDSPENDERRAALGYTGRDVPQRNSHSVRGSLAYRYSHVAVRAQVIQETWRFDRVLENVAGAYDRDSRLVALGISLHR